ncbi:hypothetical protein [Pseudomonas paraeruginosa]|uniref:hypothetical protein n=1 Tax=Pseudomonas paraeruginosa TaxID=2994495 RepID=UPI0039FD2D19
MKKSLSDFAHERGGDVEIWLAQKAEDGAAFFATDPATASDRRLLLDEEVREIHQKIRLSDHCDAVKLESRWALRPGDILQYMNELKPTIVHFSGHGSDQNELVLQDRNGDAAFVPMASIVATFELYDSVRLVYF